jgi:hypothetical protein
MPLLLIPPALTYTVSGDWLRILLRQKQPSGCEVRILMGASPAVTACSLTINLHEPCGSDIAVRAAEELAGGEDYGYFD